jgi:hypothetical protein
MRYRQSAVRRQLARQRDDPGDLLGAKSRRCAAAYNVRQYADDELFQIWVARTGGLGSLQRRHRARPAMSPTTHALAIDAQLISLRFVVHTGCGQQNHSATLDQLLRSLF